MLKLVHVIFQTFGLISVIRSRSQKFYVCVTGLFLVILLKVWMTVLSIGINVASFEITLVVLLKILSSSWAVMDHVLVWFAIPP